MNSHTLIQPLPEPFFIELVDTTILLLLHRLDAEAVLNSDLAAILLTKKSTNNGALVVPLVTSGNKVGNLKDREWVKNDLETGV